MTRPWRTVYAVSAVAGGLFLGWLLIMIAESLSYYPVVPESPTAQVYLAGPGQDARTLEPGQGIALDMALHKSGVAYAADDPRAEHGQILVKHFTLSDADLDRRLAAHFTLGRRIMSVRLNGTPLYTASSHRSWSGNSGFSTDTYSLPRDLLRTGQNTLVLSSNSNHRIVFPVITIGDAGPIMQSVWWSRFFAGLGVGMAAALLAFVTLLFVIVDWPRRDHMVVTGVTALTAVWCLYNLNVLGWPHLPPPWHSVVGYITPYLVIAGFAFSTAARMNTPRWLLWAIPSVAAVACCVPLIASLFGPQTIFEWSWPIEVWAKMLIAPVLVIALGIHHARDEDASWLVTTAYVACLFAMGLDGVDDRFDITVPFLSHLPLGSYALPWFGAVFALGMSAAIATQAARARRVAVEHNDILEARLKEQQGQLAEYYRAEREMARERIINDERQRLMRNMHDGIGGHLVSLIVQARAGKYAPKAMERSLQSALDDLRLIVDSLDTAGDSLGFAIGAFRSRLEPRLREAGVHLTWSIDPHAAEAVLGPETVLDTLRIAQEAFSNALQHSGGDRIALALGLSGDGSALTLTITDNGQGWSAGPTGGRGLASMRQRAERMGGQLRVGPAERSGVAVELRIPRPGP